jgi:AcrR family transcriptional regulator
MAESGSGPGLVVGSDFEVSIDLQPLFQKLKPGPGLPADRVIADQRRRIHGAMIALMAQTGWGRVRVRSLALGAGVSTSTFYKHFINADDCLASTYDALIATAVRNSVAAQRRELDWRDALRATVGCLMEQAAANPRAARLALVEIFDAGSVARKRIGVAVARLEELLIASFETAPRTVVPPRHLIAGMTAGMLRVARTTTLAGRAGDLPAFAGQLTTWMLALPGPAIRSLPSNRAGLAATATKRERHPYPDAAEEGGGAVIGDDRERLLAAAVRLAMADGVGAITAPRLRAEVGISRRRFDAQFGDLNECLLDAVEMVGREATVRAGEWAVSDDDWQRRTCRFTLSLCAQVARNRGKARFAFLGISGLGVTGLLRRETIVGQMAAGLLDTVPTSSRPSAIAAEASVAAVWQIAQLDIAAARASGLPLVAPLLSYVALAPMVGATAALEVIQSELGTVRRAQSLVEIPE